MAGSENLWAVERKNVLESAKKALLKVKGEEKKNTRNGWRWIAINSRTKIFVPCDENGNPTKEGRRKIQEVTKNM